MRQSLEQLPSKQFSSICLFFFFCCCCCPHLDRLLTVDTMHALCSNTKIVKETMHKGKQNFSAPNCDRFGLVTSEKKTAKLQILGKSLKPIASHKVHYKTKGIAEQ